MAHEFNEVKRIIMKDEDLDGYMRVKYLRERNSGWFNGLDKQVTPDQKLVVDDRTIDEWLVAHYKLTLDEIPHTKPDGMASWVFERLKKYFFINMKNQEKDIKKALKA